MALTRRRIATRNPKVTGTGGGGGGATGTLAMGPNFGQSGDTHKTTAKQLPPALYELIFSNQGTVHAQQLAPNTFELIFSNQATTHTSLSAPTYQRNYDMGSNSVTQTGVTGTGWTSITNAQGLHNGTNASFAGSATAAQAGTLNLAYADIPDWTTFGFTLVSANLDFYTTQAGTTLGNGGLAHKYSVGGGTITLATFTGNVTNAPATYDITSAITNQTTLNALTAYVSETTTIANLTTATCDAVEFRMVVTHV